MKVSEERLAEYNGRMNDWIAKQGLIFQLTHGGTGLGGRPPIIGSLIRAVISLILLTLFAAVAYVGFLFWKASGDQLPKELNAGIADGLNVEKVTAAGFDRTLSSGEYKQVMAQGNEDTFFNHFDARNVTFQMSPTSGLFGDWDARALQIGELKVAVKAGEANDEEASRSWQSLFQVRPSFTFTRIEVSKATFSWGYSSPATWGSIIESTLVANRKDGGWDLEFRGGSFSHGIFRDFHIEELLVSLDEKEGFEITKATLRLGKGTFSWSAKMSSGGASPLLKIDGNFDQLPIAAFLPRGLLSFVNGTFSGELEGEGSINDTDGICFQIACQPSSRESVYLTKEFTLLRLLSHLDPQRSYRKLPFNAGSFQLTTKGTTLEFSEIELAATEKESSKVIARLQGNLSTRPATLEDLEDNEFLIGDSDETTGATIGTQPELSPLTTNRANLGARILNQFGTLQFQNPHRELIYLTRDADNEELKKKRISLLPRRRFRMPFTVDGEVRLAIPGTAFEETIPLPQVALEDQEEGLRWIAIQLQGFIPQSSSNLSDQWEQALEEVEQEGL